MVSQLNKLSMMLWADVFGGTCLGQRYKPILSSISFPSSNLFKQHRFQKEREHGAQECFCSKGQQNATEVRDGKGSQTYFNVHPVLPPEQTSFF